MKIQEIAQKVQEQHRTEAPLKTTIKPIYEPTELRQFFLEVLTDQVKGQLIVNESNEKQIDLICAYLNREPKFLQLGYSFDRGLWLAGHYGSGKTQLMLTYRKAKSILFGETVGFKTCVQMNEAFMRINEHDGGKIEGEKAIKTFANKFDTVERIFDDLGEEELTVNNYGNKTCVMAKILSERYKGFPDVKTHITTNLSREDVMNEYGGRIESRIYEMFNFITLGMNENDDLRKTK